MLPPAYALLGENFLYRRKQQRPGIRLAPANEPLPHGQRCRRLQRGRRARRGDVLDQIRHFFEHYKDLEPGKWVKVKGWKSPEEAEKLIMEGVHGYESMEVKPKTA